MRERKVITAAERVPVIAMSLGQNKHQPHRGIATMKRFERMHEHGTASHGKELLGQVFSHAQPFASGNDDHTLVHNRVFYF